MSGTSQLRVLVVAQLRPGGNGPERVAAIEALGYAVTAFDTLPFQRQGSRTIRSLSHRTNVGGPVRALNAALAAVATEQNYDLVWIDKGVWIYPETLAALKRKAQTGLAIHYSPDAQFSDNRSRHFFRCLPDYDLAVTTKPAELKKYRAAGARDVILILQGYSGKFRPGVGSAERRRNLAAEVCFIGRRETHYERRLRAAAEATDDLAIWGQPWPNYARRHAWASRAVRGAGLWGDDYPTALSAARIALGLLTKRSPETTTTRSFEIPASGGFLLAERTDDHLALFKEGREADFFSSDEEMVDKIRFYLGHESVRSKIAEAGQIRCVLSGYDLVGQFRRVFAYVAKLHGIAPPI